MTALDSQLNPHAIAVLILTGFALFLFTRNRLPLESSSLAILVVLTLGFGIFPFEQADGETLDPLGFFHGFGHEALVAVIALMVIGHGLARTGALEPVGRVLSRLWSVSPLFSLLCTLVVGAGLSAFVNNVPIVILLLPILTSVSLRTGKPASKILMPMGFATLLGGMATTIGTSTNLLVVSVATDMGMPRFGMFDFYLPVVMSGGIAILYLWLVAPRLLPAHKTELGDSSPRIFSATLHVQEGGWSDGRTIAELVERTEDRISIPYLRRGESELLFVARNATQVKAGDQLVVHDTADNLKYYEKRLDVVLYNSDRPVDEDHPLQAEGQQLAELIVTQGSPLEKTTLAITRFADRYQLVTLALHRSAFARQPLRDIANTWLEVGDVLLVQGASEQIAELKKEGEILVLDATSDLPKTKKAPLALTIMIAVVAVAALGLLPIAISAVAGVLALALTRCLSWSEMAQAVNTQIILIVAASLALGAALLETGAAGAMAAGFVTVTASSPVFVQLSGLMLLMAVLTNIVSNNAAAVIGTPIAIGIAQQLGLAPQPFVLAVLFGANMSYATPMAYKTNLLVMTVGGYSFRDFLRVGIPLTLIMWLSLSLLLPVYFPL